MRGRNPASKTIRDDSRTYQYRQIHKEGTAMNTNRTHINNTAHH